MAVNNKEIELLASASQAVKHMIFSLLVMKANTTGISLLVQRKRAKAGKNLFISSVAPQNWTVKIFLANATRSWKFRESTKTTRKRLTFIRSNRSVVSFLLRYAPRFIDT